MAGYHDPHHIPVSSGSFRDPHYTSELYANGGFSLSVASGLAAGITGVTTPAADQDQLVVVCLNAREAAAHLYERLGLDVPASEAGVVRASGIFTWVRASAGGLEPRVCPAAAGSAAPVARIAATSITDGICEGLDYCYRFYDMVTTACDLIADTPRFTRVIAHCALGVSRSVTFAVLFLMVYNQVSHEVLKSVRRARRCARPNERFLEWLRVQTAVVLTAKERGAAAAVELVDDAHKATVARALAAAARLREAERLCEAEPK